MPDRTAIEWTDATWNPVTGCTKVSAGPADHLCEQHARPVPRGDPGCLHPARLCGHGAGRPPPLSGPDQAAPPSAGASPAVALASQIWMGVLVETQRWTERVAILRTIPAAVKFLSCEPLLGPQDLDLTGIDWVIVGGESGHGARPMQAQWATGIRDQCLQSQVPFFFKQWEAFDAAGVRRGKKTAGRLLQGRFWNEMPQG